MLFLLRVILLVWDIRALTRLLMQINSIDPIFIYVLKLNTKPDNGLEILQ
jgi:hypothetical protein